MIDEEYEKMIGDYIEIMSSIKALEKELFLLYENLKECNKEIAQIQKTYIEACNRFAVLYEQYQGTKVSPLDMKGEL